MATEASTGSDVRREQLGEALAASEGRVRALLEAAVDAIISIDERGIIQLVNHAAEQMFGYSAQELIGKNVSLLMPSPYREEHDGYLARYLATGEKKIIGIRREVVGLRKDGTTFPQELSVAEARLGDCRFFVGFHRDITEQKRTEEQFRLVVEFTPNAIVMINAEGNIVLANAQAEKFFGYRREELAGQPVEILMPERFRSEHAGYCASFFTSPSARPMGAGRDLYGRRKDGSEFPVEIGLAPIQTGDGLLVLSAIVDITERKRAEEALRGSERRFRALAENVPLLVWTCTPERLCDYVNPQFTRYTGLPEESFLGNWRLELIHPDDHAALFAAWERSMGEVVPVEFEFRMRRHDGAWRWFQVRAVPLCDEHGQIVKWFGTNTDIDDRKRVEAALRQSHEELEKLVAELRAKDEEVQTATRQLWQAAKLASVGELAASIAHELNNPLATVSLRVESALARTPADDPRRKALEIIEQETKRMGNLVSNLLQFSHRGHEEISTVDVRGELTTAVELIHYHLRKRLVTVVQEFAPDTPPIYADRQRLRQVFLNLLINASDAMPEGGTLTLRTAPTTLHNDKTAVLIEVADTGQGIPAESLDKVMEPFFTTKEEGKGTGLGLAICRRVVQEHHGTIEIGSEVGKGSTVRIVLPGTSGTNTDQLRSAGPVE